MTSSQFFQQSNNNRLIKIATTPRKHFVSKPLMVNMPPLMTDVNDKQFDKTIDQTTTYYG